MDRKNENSRRARVFISCGQTKGSDELKVAHDIQDKLEAAGFDTWIAVDVHSLRGLRENIFEQLTNSEYFVFVDFKRDKLQGSNHCRGSLFSNQELALASYLEIPAVIFQESGVKERDGILQCLQGNATVFTNRRDLPKLVAQRIVREGWNPRHRNELFLERDAKQYFDHLQTSGDTGRFYYIAVHNLHRSRTATDCYAYLEKAIALDSKSKIQFRSVEFKWAGYNYPSVNIPPRNERSFDAFFILHSDPTRLQFRTFSDSRECIPQIQGKGKYQLDYLVVSENFPPGTNLSSLEPV